MPLDEESDLGLVLTFCRRGQGWSQSDVALRAGFSATLVSEYERGTKRLTRPRLEFLIGLLGLPPERIDRTLACLAENRAASYPPGDPGDFAVQAGRKTEAVADQVSDMSRQFVRSMMRFVTREAEALSRRQNAEQLWARLKRHTPAGRRAAVEEGVAFQDWALCERVAAESITQAPNHPKEALELGFLALKIAERVPGEQTWRWRLQGQCWAKIANARRVLEDLRGADDAMARASKLWEDGAPGDPGLLNPVWLPWIEGNLRRAQRRFPSALKRIEEALALDGGELRGKILVSKSNLLKVLGDPEGSTVALEEAAPLIDGDREPRLALVVLFNLLEDLCQCGRAEEAAPRIQEVRRLAERLGEPLDLGKVVWLEGKAAAGLGKVAEARAAFDQARRQFHASGFFLLYALVSLDLAHLLLEQGRAAEVRELATEMVCIFRAQEMQPEALVALRFFCDAAEREAATVHLTRRIIRFLGLLQLDPELRFETEGAEVP